ncbi:MAG TPA: GNAT family N-acetyltransferase [Candidatus Binataceae bacterium]|nr:GNAT family N-acetyltransferase [Candidatus Binataceae bacterium]
MAIEVKVLHAGDDHVLMKVAPEVFDYPVDPALVHEFLVDPRHHIAVAIDDGVVVGFASAVHYIHPDKPPELWINEVGLAPTHRRRGLGKAVLQSLFEVARAQRCKMAWVLTDRSNTAAMALYKSVGGKEGVDDARPDEAMLGFRFEFETLTRKRTPARHHQRTRPTSR